MWKSPHSSSVHVTKRVDLSRLFFVYITNTLVHCTSVFVMFQVAMFRTHMTGGASSKTNVLCECNHRSCPCRTQPKTACSLYERTSRLAIPCSAECPETQIPPKGGTYADIRCFWKRLYSTHLYIIAEIRNNASFF